MCATCGCGHPHEEITLEQQRRTSGLDAAVRKFGDLEVRIHLKRDALQLARPLERGDEGAQIVMSHKLFTMIAENS